MNIEPLTSLDEILPILIDCDLPIADICASTPPQFFGFRAAGNVVAIIGLDQFESVGLLRSLAVISNYRGQGLAQKLVSYLESFAAFRDVESLFLLTTSTEAFFAKLGYRPSSRQEAPQAIQSTPQFLGICPSSSAFLFKRIKQTTLVVDTNSSPTVRPTGDMLDSTDHSLRA